MVISNQNISFKLSGINYTGTSTQLNYTSGVIQGEAQASKAFILDANKSASGIGSLTMSALTANSITGTLHTSSQPNVTSLGTLTSLTVNGVVQMQSMIINSVTVSATGNDLNLLAGITPGTVTASKAVIANASRNINNINSLSLVDLISTGVITYKGSAITADGTKINYIDTTPGIAAGTKALVLDPSRDINNIRNLTATGIIATSVTGLLQTAAQPNVTSLGTLTGLNMNGSISGVVDLTLSGILTANSVNASTLTGTVQTAAQGNITSLGTLTSLTVNGSSSINNLTVNNLTLGSTSVDATAVEINRLAGAAAGNASASKALILDASRDIGNIRNFTATSVTATSVTGTLQTGVQGNITSLGTLNSLTVANSLTSSYSNNTTTVTPYLTTTNTSSTGSVTARLELSNAMARFGTTTEHALRFLCNNAVSMSLDTNGNVSIGTQTTSAFKLNVSGSVNVTSFSINGIAMNATSAELNALASAAAGTASANKCLVLDTNRNLGNINDLSATTMTATTLTGTLQTGAQPNVTSLGTLSNLSINSSGNSLTLQNSNSSSAASLRLVNNLRTVEIGLAGNGATSNSNLMYVLDGTFTRMVMDSSGNFTFGGSNNSNGYRMNIVGSLNSTTLAINGTNVTSSAVEINTLAGVAPGTASPGKTMVLDASRDIINIRSLTATSLIGTIITSAQPNVTSVGTLTSLSLSGAITGATDVTISGALNSSSVSATNISGTIQTGAQPNITALGSLSNLNVSTNIKVGTVNSNAADMLHIEGNNLNGLGMQIENRNTTSNSMTYMKFTGYSASNDNYDLASISCGYVAANANFGYGYLAFATRNNSSSSTATERMRITESGNVGIRKTAPAYELDVDGSVNATEFRLSGTAISATAVELNRLAAVSAGTAAAGKALVLDLSRDIINIRNLTASTLGGVLQTGSQTGVTELGTLVNLSVSGPSVLTGALTVNGNTSFSNSNITSVNSLVASSLTGTLQTAAQPNVSSLGVLTSLVSSGSAKLGISANSAQDIIHVEGSNSGTIGIQLDNTSTASNSGTHIKFNGYNISNTNYDLARITCGYVAANANFGYGYLSFSTRNVSANSTATERMRITENGAVGIGTSSPSQALEVNGGIRSSRILVNSSDTARLVSILNPSMSINTEEFLTLGRSNNSMNQGEISFSYAADGSTGNALRFGLFGATRRLVVHGNGYVGIGMPISATVSNNLTINQMNTSNAVTILYDAGNSQSGINLGTTTNNKLFVQGGALFSNTNIPTATGFVNINGFDSIEVYNYGYITDGGNTGWNGYAGFAQVSLRTSNRIVAGGEIDIVSDVRLKTGINDMSLDYCKKFIEKIKPKSYKYKNAGNRKNGFVAQDIAKEGFIELIGFSKEDVPELVDPDGFVSPAGQIFTVNYDGIIPILTKCIQDLYSENKMIKERLAALERK